jgi:cystathionine beta-synthase
MTRSVHTLAPDAPITEVQRVLDQGLVVVVAGAAGFHGLITRFDLLNHLRRTLT